MIIGWLLILGAVSIVVVDIARRFTPRIALHNKISQLEHDVNKRDELIGRITGLCQDSPFDENPLRVQVLDEIHRARIGGRNEFYVTATDGSRWLASNSGRGRIDQL